MKGTYVADDREIYVPVFDEHGEILPVYVQIAIRDELLASDLDEVEEIQDFISLLIRQYRAGTWKPDPSRPLGQGGPGAATETNRSSRWLVFVACMVAGCLMLSPVAVDVPFHQIGRASAEEFCCSIVSVLIGILAFRWIRRYSRTSRAVLVGQFIFVCGATAVCVWALGRIEQIREPNRSQVDSGNEIPRDLRPFLSLDVGCESVAKLVRPSDGRAKVRSAIFAIDPKSGLLRPTVWSGTDFPSNVGAFWLDISPQRPGESDADFRTRRGAAGYTYATKDPIFENSLEQHRSDLETGNCVDTATCHQLYDYKKLHGEISDESLIVLPIFDAGNREIVGVLSVSSTTLNAFSPKNVSQAKTFARVLGGMADLIRERASKLPPLNRLSR